MHPMSTLPGEAGATQALRPPTVVASGGSLPRAGDRGARVRRAIAYVLIVAYALLMFLPFLWSVSTSFKTQAQSDELNLIPQPVSTLGYERAFNELDPGLPRLFLNSLLIAAAATASNVALGAMAGYAFARLRFPGRELLFVLVLGTMMIPDQLRLVPIYQILRAFGLLQGPLQFVGVWLVLAISAASIFLFRQYFMSIPRALEEAAKIDGAGFFTTFLRVVLPLATPAIAAVAILQFQGAWNGFFWPNVILQQRDNWTLPLGLSQFQDLYNTQWPPLMAVVVLATLPILVLYVFFQRYFVEGIAAAGVKG
jgi:multiple sugar transport system permease protein